MYMHDECERLKRRLEAAELVVDYARQMNLSNRSLCGLEAKIDAYDRAKESL